MSVEEDIGGLKADMKTVKDQASKIFDKMDEMHTAMTAFTATTSERQKMGDERFYGLKGSYEELEGSVATLRANHDSLSQDTPSQTKIFGAAIVGIPVVGLVGAWIGKLWTSINH